MSEPRETVECAEHGNREMAIVCRHLAEGKERGFHRSSDLGEPSDEIWPDAWCDACEDVLVSEGEWNDRAVASADFRLLCSGCYEYVRALNWKEDLDAFGELVDDAVGYLQARQDELQSRFKLGEHARYDWDQGTGELVFSDEGRVKVVADFQFVGSLSNRSKTWMWSWANSSITESVKDQVRRVRAYGEEHHYLKVAAALWTAEEEDGWEMTAIAAYLLSAKGAYSSPDDRGSSFLIMTDIRWAD